MHRMGQNEDTGHGNGTGMDTWDTGMGQEWICGTWERDSNRYMEHGNGKRMDTWDTGTGQ